MAEEKDIKVEAAEAAAEAKAPKAAEAVELNLFTNMRK